MKDIRKALLALLLCVLPSAVRAQAPDTLRVSDLFTTHILFSTDLIYADLSNTQAVAAKIIEQSKNMLAVKARGAFGDPLSITALESNGHIHTFILMYDENPSSLVVDRRPEAQGNRAGLPGTPPPSGSHSGRQATLTRRSDAPSLVDVSAARRSIYHIGAKSYGISVMCENIISVSDITYMVFSLRNDSGVSYECSDATFVIESSGTSRNAVDYNRNIYPRSRFGSLTAAPKQTVKIAYALEKMSLSKDQVLNVYFYETDGHRSLVLPVSYKDINKASNGLR